MTKALHIPDSASKTSIEDVDTVIPDLSVLIVSHGHGALVAKCLASLTDTALAGLRAELIVVDNLAEPDFLDQIGGARPGLKLCVNKKPLGFGANMNRAAAQARGRLLLLLNPDTTFHGGSIATAAAWLEADSSRGVVAARLLNSDLSDQRNFRQFPSMAITVARGLRADRWAWRPKFYRDSLLEDKVIEEPTRVDWVYGSFMLIRASSFHSVGGFDEGYFMYYEDVDLCFRLGRRGLGVFVYPDLTFVHDHHRDSAQSGSNALRQHHIRSFLRYLRRTHAYLSPPAVQGQQRTGWKAQVLVVALVLCSVLMAGWLVSAVSTVPMAQFAAVPYALCVLLAQFMLQEFDPARLGDAPRRVVGVVESSILALMPWLLILLVSGQTLSGYVLSGFVGLAVFLAGLATYVGARLLPDPGTRLGVVLATGSPGLAGGVPVLPVGSSAVVASFEFAHDDLSRTVSAISEAIRQERIDHLVVVGTARDNPYVLQLLHALAMFDVPVWHSLRVGPFGLPDRPLLLRGPLRSRAREGLKRGLDLAFGLMALTTLAIPMAVVALAIKLDDGGPVFFAQPRLGRNQTLFPMLKFRSMDAAKSDRLAVQLTTRNDPRITRIGAFLRRTSIDELPQLFNVLAGHMSIVGPRPLPNHFHYKGMAFEGLIPEWHYRTRVRPGITGLSQLRGLRGTPDSPEEATAMMQNRVHYDNLYIDHWTIWLDFRIILMTALSGAFMSGS